LFGTFSIGVAGYFAIIGLIVLMAMVTALTSRRTVNQTLESIN
jgi:cell division transport system permease protein